MVLLIENHVDIVAEPSQSVAANPSFEQFAEFMHQIVMFGLWIGHNKDLPVDELRAAAFVLRQSKKLAHGHVLFFQRPRFEQDSHVNSSCRHSTTPAAACATLFGARTSA